MLLMIGVHGSFGITASNFFFMSPSKIALLLRLLKAFSTSSPAVTVKPAKSSASCAAIEIFVCPAKVIGVLLSTIVTVFAVPPLVFTAAVFISAILVSTAPALLLIS